MFRNVLVAIDGTATSDRAFATAVALAKEQRATLHIVHVVDQLLIAPMLDPTGIGSAQYIESTLDALRETGRRMLDRAGRAARKSTAKVDVALVESRGRTVSDTILRQAKKLRADLIVLGTHGRRGLRRVVMGSDAEGVVREATAPVLLVRARSRARR